MENHNNNSIYTRFILGLLIGIAIIIPGLSGSTFAIIFNLYDKLLEAVSNLITKFKKSIQFLLPILLGTILGVFIGFITIRKLLDIVPFSLICLFTGLMIGSYHFISIDFNIIKKKKKLIIIFILGISIPIIFLLYTFFTHSSDKNLLNINPFNLILLIIIGYLIAITQIIPGLSATSLLMTIGYFIPLFNTINVSFWRENTNIFFVYILLFLGFIIGLITFSKFLTFILKKYTLQMNIFISGLALSSIFTMLLNENTINIINSWITGNISLIYDLPLGIILFFLGIKITNNIKVKTSKIGL